MKPGWGRTILWGSGVLFQCKNCGWPVLTGKTSAYGDAGYKDVGYSSHELFQKMPDTEVSST